MTPRRLRARSVLAAPRESEIQRSILEALLRHRVVADAWVQSAGAVRKGPHWIQIGRKGQLDIGGVLAGGRYFEIEVKRPGEKPTDEQTERIASLMAAGCVAGVATSVDDAIGIVEAR